MSQPPVFSSPFAHGLAVSGATMARVPSGPPTTAAASSPFAAPPPVAGAWGKPAAPPPPSAAELASRPPPSFGAAPPPAAAAAAPTSPFAVSGPRPVGYTAAAAAAAPPPSSSPYGAPAHSTLNPSEVVGAATSNPFAVHAPSGFYSPAGAAASAAPRSAPPPSVPPPVSAPPVSAPSPVSTFVPSQPAFHTVPHASQPPSPYGARPPASVPPMSVPPTSAPPPMSATPVTAPTFQPTAPGFYQAPPPSSVPPASPVAAAPPSSPFAVGSPFATGVQQPPQPYGGAAPPPQLHQPPPTAAAAAAGGGYHHQQHQPSVPPPSVPPPSAAGAGGAPPPSSAAVAPGSLPPMNPNMARPAVASGPAPHQQVTQRPGQRIDPLAIPSPAMLVQRSYEQGLVRFQTRVHHVPPPADTHFVAVDEGNCNPRFMRSTMYTLPTTPELAKNSGLPFAVVIQPFAEPATGEEPVPVVDMGPSGPIRCTRCRAYINPFVLFIDGGRQFRCNLCSHINDVPQEYFSPLQGNGYRLDLAYRSELTHGSVDFVASSEYISRPPEPLSIVFAIDVSAIAVNSGLVKSATTSIAAILKTLPETCPYRVGILTYDESLHFYNLKEALLQPQMLVVADTQEPFLPIGVANLVVPFTRSQHVIYTLLEKLPLMFEHTRCSRSAFGSAVKASQLLLKQTGGKLVAFQTTLPTSGQGSLENRLPQRMLEPDQEKGVLQPQSPFYAQLGEALAADKINVNLFLAADSYVDVATLGDLCKQTSGECYYYPGFNAAHDRQKLHQELAHNLLRTAAYDSVMRIRTSTGLNVVSHHGNFILRLGTDVEAAGFSCDKSMVIRLEVQGKLAEENGAESAIQCAVLYTTPYGQRRIRVHNLSLQCSSTMSAIFRGADLSALLALNFKIAADEALRNTTTVIKKSLVESCIRVLSRYRKYCSSSSTGPSQLILPESLKLLPAYTLALLKHAIWRSDTVIDERAYLRLKAYDMSPALISTLLYPRLIPLHQLPPAQSTAIEEIPPTARLMVQSLDPSGAYLLSSGFKMFLWLGQTINPEVMSQLFGVNTLQEMDRNSVSFLPMDANPFVARVRRIIKRLQRDSPVFQQLLVIMQSDPAERKLMQHLYEDGVEDIPNDPNFFRDIDKFSHVAFLCYVHRCVLQSS